MNQFKVIVKPNSSENKVLGYDETRKALKVAVKAPAENNKANKELVKFLSKHLKKKVKIKSGLKSKEKLISFV